MRGMTIAVLALAVAALAVAPALAASDVRCMPDRQVRPGVSLPAFGAAGNVGIGDGSANGETYTWSFAPNANVTVTDDGTLTGTVTNDRYIPEVVSFALLGGSTREIVTGTLDVNGTTCSVKIDIVDLADPISDTPEEELLINVNIAIEEALRFMYLNQEGNGSWDGQSSTTAYRVASTGLCTWAFNNSGHAPDQGTIYSPAAQQGLDWIFGNSRIVSIGAHGGSNFNNHLAGTVGINTVGPNNSTYETYAAPMAVAAVAASGLPAAVVGTGPAAGLTYKQFSEEFADWAAYGQNEFGCAANNLPCGGWVYSSGSYASSSSFNSDMSINSWMYVGLEGVETVFGGVFNPRMKDNIPVGLVDHQYGVAGPYFGRTGYRNTTPVRGNIGYATTCAGLSGLAFVDLPGNKSAGTPNFPAAGAPANLDTSAEKRDAALGHLGRWWGRNPNGAVWLYGNHGNHYAMWTCARGLRLQGVSQLNNDGSQGGTVGLFDWEKNIAPAGDVITRGYWPFLVGTQKTTGAGCSSGLAGCWQTGLSQYNDNFDTCTGVLILQPTVFGPPEEPCPEDPDPKSQGYWHRQCLGLPESEGGIDPGRNGRGPKSPTEPGFVDELMPCAEARLTALGFDTETTCSGMDADPPSDKCEKALKQLTANILNVCSERILDGCEVDASAYGCMSTDVGDLIQEITDLIDAGDCDTANSCAAALNEGDALVSDGGGFSDDVGYSVDEPVRPRSIRNVDLDDDESKQRRRSIRREKVGDDR